jgi:hypothetical protein
MNFYIPTSVRQPAVWWRTWTNTLFCPKCNAGQIGKFPEYADPCPGCGWDGDGFIKKVARLVDARTWYKPWTWGYLRLEVQE